MEEQLEFNFTKNKAIKGYPELHWAGKRPYTSTVYYPAQLKESYGEEIDGWKNKIFWGDNLQVMSHLLKKYRGKVDLIYIDPPFDSKADYKKTIRLKGNKVEGDSLAFEEKQYSDIWTNDEYLQFMYERLILLRELLSDTGSFILHADWHKVHHLRLICDEIFGEKNFKNQIVWCYGGGGAPKTKYPSKHDILLWYTKSDKWTFNKQFRPYSKGTLERGLTEVKGDSYELNEEGAMLNDWWEGKEVQKILSPTAYENLKYPTQKPEGLLNRIIKGHSKEGDLVMDCFMGSGTTQAVAMKLNRRFIGADINLGAIQTTTKRILDIKNNEDVKYKNLEVYNVNNYDFFRNEVEAKQILIDALQIQEFSQSKVYDGELDGRMVKIMPVNRIATKADLQELIANLPYDLFDQRKKENPRQPVEYLTIVCMGHESDLTANLEKELSNYNIDIEVVDVLRDRKDLELKREADADISIEDGKLIINSFYPMNLLQKLSLTTEQVEDWRELVDSILIDFNYDGAVLSPTIHDIPDRKELVSGVYSIPKDAGNIRVKITDVLSESLEVEIENE